MSILYCTIPHFATTLERRDNESLREHPLVLIDSQRRVFATSKEAAERGIVRGLTTQVAQVRCPEARLIEANTARYRKEFESLLQILDLCSPTVEPHGWGAAYVDLGSLARHHIEAVTLCTDIGRRIRLEMGETLEPALGWDSTKFTAQTAARYTCPGRLLPIDASKQKAFLRPLSVQNLPLGVDTLRRLGFLGLRTLGQYAALPSAAVWQQFGKPGKLAHRCARGQDDRPVVPRSHERCLEATDEFDVPLNNREQLLDAGRRLVAPLLIELRGNLQGCGQVRLTMNFADRTTQERERILLFPTATEARINLTLEQLLNEMRWQEGAEAMEVNLRHIQDTATEQISLFAAENERERKLQEVQQALKTRFGAHRLWRTTLAQPGAPLPEWRVGWAT